jgi:D-sedoheptulose 7-phosphate isomerase
VAGPVEPPVDPEAEARAYLEEAARNAASLLDGDLPVLAAKAGAMLSETISEGGTVLFCGNGGSAADAQHLAAELVGRLDASRDREPLRGLALTTDTSALTALSNDFGFEEVFARQVRALGRPGDALVCLSTSGRSPNILQAAEAARGAGLRVVALVGPSASPLDDVTDVCLHLPGRSSGQVQQGHITVGHLLCRLAETA